MVSPSICPFRKDEIKPGHARSPSQLKGNNTNCPQNPMAILRSANIAELVAKRNKAAKWSDKYSQP